MATVFGIPVRLDLSLLVLMVLVWVGSFHAKAGILASLLTGTTWALLLLLSVVLHELGHCWVSVQFGCRVRSITLLLLGGRAELSHLPTKPSQELAIAVAGPLVTLALWLGGSYGAAHLVRDPASPATGYAIDALHSLAYLNVRLFWLNLVPAFPMDGGRILRAWLAHRQGRFQATRIAISLSRLLAAATLVWIFTGLPTGIHIPAGQWQIAGTAWPAEAIHTNGLNRWILGLIALFIFVAAEQEYRTVRAEAEYSRNGRRAPWMAPPDPEDQIVVSPPPYHRGTVDFRADHEKPRWWQWWA